ncbi:MAG: hypothetical protein DWP95_05040 [Proteobacteria bacterium]|nr:MAG: hypothetical protein DWP95_05040 [Pseudomonadota bacterium]
MIKTTKTICFIRTPNGLLINKVRYYNAISAVKHIKIEASPLKYLVLKQPAAWCWLIAYIIPA